MLNSPSTKHGLTRWIHVTLWTLLIPALATARAPEDPTASWLGRWVLNEERTQAIQPEQPESRNWLPQGRVSTGVSVGGIPLPRTGNQAAPVSSQSASDPTVLRIKALTIAVPDEERVTLQYGDLDSETLHRGNYRGARTSWDRKQLRTRYESTQRKVDHRYEIQEDGSLLVTTRIKPNRAKRRTYLQVFERPGKDESS
jgi:hypothetical protein